MKTTILIFILLSCNSHKTERITQIISDKDTIEIIGRFNVRFLGMPGGASGHNDTLTGVETIRFVKFDPDTIYVTYPLHIEK